MVAFWALTRCRVVCKRSFSKEKRQFNTTIEKAGCISYYWMFKLEEGIAKIRKHKNSSCYLEAASVSVIWETNGDVGKMLSDIWSKEKVDNSQILLKTLENVCFLSRQELLFRGNDRGGNFDQMSLQSWKTDSNLQNLAIEEKVWKAH